MKTQIWNNITITVSCSVKR